MRRRGGKVHDSHSFIAKYPRRSRHNRKMGSDHNLPRQEKATGFSKDQRNKTNAKTEENEGRERRRRVAWERKRERGRERKRGR